MQSVHPKQTQTKREIPSSPAAEFYGFLKETQRHVKLPDSVQYQPNIALITDITSSPVHATTTNASITTTADAATANSTNFS